jgi:hypothetical protein
MDKFILNKHLHKIIDEYLFTKQLYLDELTKNTLALKSYCNSFVIYNGFQIEKLYNHRTRYLKMGYHHFWKESKWSIITYR